MPPFLPPPEPPAQIETVTFQERDKITIRDILLTNFLEQTWSPRPCPSTSGKTTTGCKYLSLLLNPRGGKQRELNLLANGDSPSEEPTETEVEVEIKNVPVVEVSSDRQEYDEEKQVISAVGNVVMLFGETVLTGDRLEVNLLEQVLVANGNVVLERGEQLLRGDRFEYFFAEDRGTIINAVGEIYQPTTGSDLGFSSVTAMNAADLSSGSISERLIGSQPLSRITTKDGYRFVLGGGRQGNLDTLGAEGGGINRLRFQAEKVDFEGETWFATNVRLTNDPFSPPEVEVRADTAQLRKISPQVDELRTTKSRVVFDGGLSLPIVLNRLLFDSSPRQWGLFQFGVDNDERGGLFIERRIPIVKNESVEWSLTPQYFLQKALFPSLFRTGDEEGDGELLTPEVFGLKSNLNVDFGSRTALTSAIALTSFNFTDIEEKLRGSLRLQQYLGNLNRPHTLNLEYSWRDRLFNGSLGFQTVRSSIGLVVASPNIPLGETGINLRYQGGIQNINANSDRANLIRANLEEEEINLTRYQGAASLGKSFSLWRGKPLPTTAEEGLRYTPAPVVPYLQLVTGITGVGSLYSNRELQSSLNATVGLQGQWGHFSRPYFDYTGFRLFYTQAIRGDESPFLFDRIADRRTLSAGLTQQLYGPVLLGFQTNYNLDNGEEISSDYFLEYSRRTYNITLRYNPVLEIGSISLRISDFNWVGNSEPFEGSGVRSVTQGVKR